MLLNGSWMMCLISMGDIKKALQLLHNSNPNQVEANIKKVLGNLEVKLVKYGADLLGAPRGKLYDALINERHEIDHYTFHENSVMDYVFKRESIIFIVGLLKI